MCTCVANPCGPGPPKAPNRMALPWYRKARALAIRRIKSAALICAGLGVLARENDSIFQLSSDLVFYQWSPIFGKWWAGKMVEGAACRAGKLKRYHRLICPAGGRIRPTVLHVGNS